MAELNASYDCLHEPLPLLRLKFYLVFVCGSSLAVVTFFESLVIVYLFCRRRPLRRANQFYLSLISFADGFIAASFVAVIAMPVYAEYYGDLRLHELWHRYIRAWYALTHVAKCSAAYFLIAASGERYFGVVAKKTYRLHIILRTRVTQVACAIVCCSFLLRGTVYFEVAIVRQADCPGFGAVAAAQSSLAQNRAYNRIWMFWIRNLLSVFIPFSLLSYFNLAIINKLRNEQSYGIRALMLNTFVGRQTGRRLDKNLRSATRVLLTMVGCYLLSNLPNVVLAVWEQVDLQSLYTHSTFYVLAADAVNLMTILSCALRLPIYLVCSPSVRGEILMLFCRGFVRAEGIVHNARRKRRPSTVRQSGEMVLINL